MLSVPRLLGVPCCLAGSAHPRPLPRGHVRLRSAFPGIFSSVRQSLLFSTSVLFFMASATAFNQTVNSLFSTISPDDSFHHLLTHSPMTSYSCLQDPVFSQTKSFEISDFKCKSFSKARLSSAFPERPLPPHSGTLLRSPMVVIISVHFISNKTGSTRTCFAER